MNDLWFWRRVKRGAPDDCWPWTGTDNGNGYGRLKVRGGLYLAHRVAYLLGNGDLQSSQMHRSYHGTVVRHSCDNPSCCNPRHLLAGEQLDNVRDMMRRGRHRFSAISVPKEKPEKLSD